MTLIDGEQRNQATDPGFSFIVQAPAGSGKTEILTQRYLRLLGTVTAPEQIIALTFTRKAASEMRERIVLALQQAAQNQPAASPHQQRTLEYAHQALACSNHHAWDLLHQPNRLKIVTIDSLCQSINQAVPLLEKQIAYAQITDKPENYYLKAARNCINFAIATPDYQSAIKTLLLHVDNRKELLIALFREMLIQRDQWLSLIFQARRQEKQEFEHGLQLIAQHELARFKSSIPNELAEHLTALAREVAQIENNPAKPRFILKEWNHFKESSPEIITALSKLILGSDGELRKCFDHHVGLLKTECSAEDYKRIKTQSTELLEQLGEYPLFLDSLNQVCLLPNPRYNEEQWETLQALFLLLPLLVGHLHILFSESNEVDFTTVSQQALVALGDSENPTDLALYLDHNIHHLLVDEFQDTSITQFELLSKLVQGWQRDDGKTLFLVGDPMQSIYRFRQAEVGLFYRAKSQGIGPVHLKSLELSCNFRSTETIIQWVNNQFKSIFPQQVDIESGAVSFHPSVNVIKNNQSSKIQAFQLENKEQEARKLIELIQHELQCHPEDTIAILVRSRTQLAEIINVLREHQIPYQGTDIDLLSNLRHLRDVWSLTEALLFPGNRLSWLSMLHSPYCGLNLSDIHLIANLNRRKSIYSALLQLEKIQGLSDEGRARASFFTMVIHQALAQRYQYRLSEWLILTLKKLHVDTILNQSQLKDLEQLWTLVDRYEVDGRVPDKEAFLNEFHKLYSQQSTPSRLQIMTIHKSKGLEFDTVILPGLGSQANAGDSPMLRWLKLPTQGDDNLLLASPIQAAHHDSCPLYDYLNRIEREKGSYEAQRLLYVAVTRAKSRLYLCDSSSRTVKSSFRYLLKSQEFSAELAQGSGETQEKHLPALNKLPLEFYHHIDVQPANSLKTSTSELMNSIPRLTGIVTHQILQWICDYHPPTLNDIPWNLARTEFQQLGFDDELIAASMELLKKHIITMFQDPIGKWIMAQHEQERNEYQLLVEHQGNVVTRIIDRLFEAENKLWIIDFKTGKEDDLAVKQHQQQLNEYAYYLSSRSRLPIQCGIYYLNNNHWINWEYQTAEFSLI